MIRESRRAPCPRPARPREETGAEQPLAVVDLGLDAERARIGIDGRGDERDLAFEGPVREGAHADLDPLTEPDALGVELGQAEDRLEGAQRDQFEERLAGLDELAGVQSLEEAEEESDEDSA